MNLIGSVEAVVAAIREDAREETARIAREADEATATLRRDDAARPAVVPLADARLREARRRARERVAQEDRTDRQAAMNAREAWVAQVVAAAMQKALTQPEDTRRADLMRFAREALERLPDADCEVLVAASDLPLLDEAVRRDLATATRGAVSVKASPDIQSGCVVRTIDGRMQFDNTHAARARRFEPYWRHALGELFARPMVVHA